MVQLRAFLRSLGGAGAVRNAGLALVDREVEDFLVASLTRRLAYRAADDLRRGSTARQPAAA